MTTFHSTDIQRLLIRKSKLENQVFDWREIRLF
jgi:hypothetical protein